MSVELAVIAVIVVAMAFDYTNGFHDAANAIATSVSTRALTPRVALLIAALGNLAGSFFGAKVAKTVGSGLVTLPPGVSSLGVVFAGVVGAIGWNLITWYIGLPSSSSHALFGGLVGATFFAADGVIHWNTIATLVLLPMVLSPLVGFLLGAVVMFLLLWSIKGLTVWSARAAPVTETIAQVREPVAASIGGAGTERSPTVVAEPRVAVDPAPRSGFGSKVRRRVHHIVQPGPLNRFFRGAQTVSAGAMAVGHGMQDAAKTIGIIVLALYTGGIQESKTHIPVWVYFTSATVLALGTYAGGWRIIRTLGRRVIDLRPPEGFAAETVASSVLWFNSLVLGAPISTTHTITSAIMGVGAMKKVSAVRWGVAGNIVTAWILTFPGSAAIAVLVYFLVRPLF